MPNLARVYDYLLGGKDNFAADRQAAQLLIEATPDMAGVVRDNRGSSATWPPRQASGKLVEPGVPWINEWRPDRGTDPAGPRHSLRGGVGRRN